MIIFSFDYLYFCDSEIPTTPWNLDDYAKWLFDLLNKKQYDVILGYSFGAAVITHCMFLYKDKILHLPKIVLVSPAITRQYQHATGIISWMSKTFIGTFPGIVRWARDLYLLRVVKNPFYREGGFFQRETYRRIVGVDLSSELDQLLLAHMPMRLIFGSKDTATPPSVLLEKIPAAQSVMTIIQNGGHDIANSHTSEVVAVINQ